MLPLREFRDYIKEIETEIPELTVSRVVIDDSQLSKFLEKQLPNAYLLLGIIPKHNYQGKIDNLKSIDRIAILVLKKVNRKDQDHNIFLDTIESTQTVTQKVIDKLLTDFQDDNKCSFIKFLDVGSQDINPIYGLNSCDGYEIDFNTKTNL